MKNWIICGALFTWAIVATLLYLHFITKYNVTILEHDANDDEVSSPGNPQAMGPRLDRYFSKIFRYKPKDDEREEFTIIMMTYKREKVLPDLLLHYCKIKNLHKILVIWNDVGTQIPGNILKVANECQVTLQFIKETENKVTNRFKPRPEIETDCVCIIDDDRFYTNVGDLEFGFSVWQNFRHRIVGYEERTYTYQPDGSLFYVGTKHHGGYAMMIGATTIFHRAYLEMYFDPDVLPKGIFDYINNITNCDDIALSIMVTKFLEDVSWKQTAALLVKNIGEIQNWEDKAYVPGGHRGLSRQPDHYMERTKCLNHFAAFYGGCLPLHNSSVQIHRA